MNNAPKLFKVKPSISLKDKVKSEKTQKELDKFIDWEQFGIEFIDKSKKPKLRLLIAVPESFRNSKLVKEKLKILEQYYIIEELIEIDNNSKITQSLSKLKGYSIYNMRDVFENNIPNNSNEFIRIVNKQNTPLINYSNYVLGFIPKDDNNLDLFIVNIIKLTKQNNKNHQFIFY